MEDQSDSSSNVEEENDSAEEIENEPGHADADDESNEVNSQ